MSLNFSFGGYIFIHFFSNCGRYIWHRVTGSSSLHLPGLDKLRAGWKRHSL